MNLFTIITIVQLLLIILIYYLSRNTYSELIKTYGSTFQFSFIANVSLYIIDKLKLMERFENKLTYIHHKVISIYGNKHGFLYTKMFVAQLISSVILFLFIFSLFAAFNNDPIILFYGIIIVVIIPILLVKGLDRKVRKKHNQIIMELPEFLNKVTLLVNAGETIQRAIIKSTEQNQNLESSYLYQELKYSVNQLNNNYSFNSVLEELSKRCGVQEVSIFTTTVLLNYKRGGAEFVLALSNLSKELWEKRKAMTRTLGEEASSKLVFPMVLIFLVVMVIIATPALMLF